jgi:hypothetical protein
VIGNMEEDSVVRRVNRLAKPEAKSGWRAAAEYPWQRRRHHISCRLVSQSAGSLVRR